MEPSEVFAFIYGALFGVAMSILVVRSAVARWKQEVHARNQRIYSELEANCIRLVNDTHQSYQSLVDEMARKQGHSIVWSVEPPPPIPEPSLQSISTEGSSK